MKKILLSILFSLSFFTFADAQRLYGITPYNELFIIPDTYNPSIVDGPHSIVGIETGQSLLAIDFGLHDGLLYGLAYNLTDNQSQLYRIERSGTAYFAIAVNENMQDDLLSDPEQNVIFNFNSAPNASGVIGDAFEVLDVAVELRDNPMVERSAFNYDNPSLFIYPNPVTDRAHIVLPTPSVRTLYVDIIDLRGQRVATYEYIPGSILLDIDMSNLPTGLYRVRVIDKLKGIQSMKVFRD